MSRLRSCPVCGRVHPIGGGCTRPKRVKESTKESRLRTCRRWDKTRKAVNERDRHLCRVCLSLGKLQFDALETHHIIPLSEAPEKAYDEDNLITLCVRHHKAADAGQIDRGLLCRLAGEPL